MGYSLAWVGVRGITYEEAISRLALEPTEETADYAERPISARSMPGGWTLVVAKGCDHRLIRPSSAASLSIGAEVVVCSVEEHVMYSSCELWTDGAKQWRVEHDAQKSIYDLAASGTLPEDFVLVRGEVAARQEAEGGKEADVDLYFEIPLVLAQARVGFKHDEVNDSNADGQFAVLIDSSSARPATSGRPWWRFWR